MSANPPSSPAAPSATGERPGAGQRVLGTVAAGLGVAALAGAAFVVSFDDLRALAEYGGAPARYSHLYPAMVDAIVVVTLLSLLFARRAGWWARRVRELLLLLLLAGAAAAGVQRNLGGYAALPADAVKVGVAAAPWALLLIAVWLWIAMFTHAREALADRTGDPMGPAAPGSAVPPAPPAPRPWGPDPDEGLIPGLTSGPAPHVPPAPEAVPGAVPERGAAGTGARTDVEPSDPPVATVPGAPAMTPAAEPPPPSSTASSTASPGPPGPLPDAADPAPEADSVPEAEAPTAADAAAGRTGGQAAAPCTPPSEAPPATDTPPVADTPPAPGGEAAGDDHGTTVAEWSTAAARDGETWAKEARDQVGTGEQAGREPIPGTPPSSTLRSSPAPPDDD